MEGSSKPTLNAKEIAKQWPEFQVVKRASFDDNWVWKAIMTHYHVYYDFCKPKCIKNDLNRFVIDYLCKPINDN